MLFNIAFAFIIPWMLGLYLYRRSQPILFLIAPIGSVLGFTIDVLGMHLNFWHIKPLYDNEVFSALPFHLGLYPILGSFLIFFIRKGNQSAYALIFWFALGTTALEFIAVIMGRVIYSNGWNIFFTFFSYLLPYILIYLYYKKLNNLNIMNNPH